MAAQSGPKETRELRKQARSHQQQGEYREAEALFRQRLENLEGIREASDLEHGSAAMDLAIVLREQGHYAEAIEWYERAFKRLVPLKNAEELVVLNVNGLALCQIELGRFDKAESTIRFAIRAIQDYPAISADTHALVLSTQAYAYRKQNRLGDAENTYRRALELLRRHFGEDHKEIARTLGNLGGLAKEKGNLQEAEKLFRQSLVMYEKTIGSNRKDIALALNNLAAIYQETGRANEAEPLLARAIELASRTEGKGNPRLVFPLANQAAILINQKRYEEALPILERGLDTAERQLGHDHRDLIYTLGHLGSAYAGLRRWQEAEAVLERAIAICEKRLGSGHPITGLTLLRLADVYRHQQRRAAAETLYRRNLDLQLKAQGTAHPNVATSHFQLAFFYDETRRPDLALEHVRAATMAMAQGLIRGTASLEENRSQRSRYLFHIGLASRHPNLLPESFSVSQLAQAQGTGQTLVRMAARFGRQDDALGKLIREQQDLVEQVRQTEKALVDAIAQEGPATAADLRERLSRHERALTEKTRLLSERFPDYETLTSPTPVSIGEVQRLLRPGEALISYLFDADGGYAWVVRPEGAQLRRLPIGSAQLSEQVQRLRTFLDPRQNKRRTPVDAALAHRLRTALFTPIESALTGTRHILVVADGALQSLPLAALSDDPQGATWLIDRYAFSTLPSVSALRSLRSFARPAPSKQAFIGFGDPELAETTGDIRAPEPNELFAASSGQEIGIANVNTLRRATRLPATAEELKTLAQTLRAPASSLYLGARATETNLKRSKLAQTRVLALATHAIMAGELAGLAEPGLILTPPDKGSQLDDGFLSASEIAQLKLNADLVMLSACNTAASDGRVGAEGLSGLAKSFFYAGARSLLVSHWYVDSKASTRLTTGMLGYRAAHAGTGKAEALQQAIRQLKADPAYSHPMFWAPFVVVGEGGD